MLSQTINLLTNADMSGTITSPSQALNISFGYSIQAIYSGSPSGIIKLRVCNDNYNFVDLADSSITISSSGSWVWNVPEAMYLYTRVVYTPTTGSGSLSLILTYKG